MSRKRRRTNDRSRVQQPTRPAQVNTPEKAEAAARSAPLLANDAFMNQMAFLGEASDLMAANTFERNSITNNTELLTVMYRENWIAKRIIDTPCEDMTRAWYTLASSLEQDKVDELVALETKHNIKQEITNGLRWARLYGGAAAVIVIKGQEDMLDQPLDYDSLMPGCFRGLIIVDKSSGLTPSMELEEDWNDPEYNYPKYYDVVLNNMENSVVRIHHSRLIPFRGRMLPLTEERNESYWGASELEHIYDELQKRNATSANIAQMVFQALITVTKISDYGEALGMATERQRERILNTIYEQNRIKNAFGMMIMGKDDSYEQHAYSFGGLQEVYEVFMLDMAGAAEIPATKLYGRAPQGMNATGESDMKNYYESIAQLQERHLRPAIKKLLPVMCMSLWGEIPQDMDIVFAPVMTTTPTERATIISQFAGTILQAYTAGLISRKRALMELVATGKDVGAWSSITQDFIDAAEDEVDQGEMGEDPMASLMGGMEGGPEVPEPEVPEPKVEGGTEELPEMAKVPKKRPEGPVSPSISKEEKGEGKAAEAPQKPKEAKTEVFNPEEREDKGKDEAVPEGLDKETANAMMTEAANRGDLKMTLAIVRAYPQYFGKAKSQKQSDKARKMRGTDDSVKRAHPSLMQRFRSIFQRSVNDDATEVEPEEQTGNDDETNGWFQGEHGPYHIDMGTGRIDAGMGGKKNGVQVFQPHKYTDGPGPGAGEFQTERAGRTDERAQRERVRTMLWSLINGPRKSELLPKAFLPSLEKSWYERNMQNEERLKDQEIIDKGQEAIERFGDKTSPLPKFFKLRQKALKDVTYEQYAAFYLYTSASAYFGEDSPFASGNFNRALQNGTASEEQRWMAEQLKSLAVSLDEDTVVYRLMNPEEMESQALEKSGNGSMANGDRYNSKGFASCCFGSLSNDYLEMSPDSVAVMFRLKKGMKVVATLSDYPEVILLPGMISKQNDRIEKPNLEKYPAYSGYEWEEEDEKGYCDGWGYEVEYLKEMEVLSDGSSV